MTRLVIFMLCLLVVGWILPSYVGAHPGSGIVVDQRGQVYFVDIQRNRIWKIDTPKRVLPFVTDKHTHHLSIDKEGTVYGEYGEGNGWISLWKATPEGKLIDPIPLGDRLKGYGFTIDRDGNIYSWVSNVHLKQESLVFRTTPDGKTSTLAGSAWGHLDGKGSNAKLSNIGGLALDSDGSVYITDGDSIRKIAKDGNVSTLASGINAEHREAAPIAEGLFNHLMGLSVDARANVYAANYAHRRVLKVTPDGKLTTLVRSERPWSPTGVATFGDTLYILEHAYMPNHSYHIRVRQLSSSGNITTIAEIKD